MGIREATKEYESWLRASLPMVIDDDLAFKHDQMASGVFPFLRATFYRWAPRWQELCPHLNEAPKILGVGDLHVENYGTWRDAEGRLVWGINDFDEACELPYSADLVRLATSVVLAVAGHHLTTPLNDAAEAILSGYEEGLHRGGRPFVLAEHHAELRRLASEGRDAVRFWTKMEALPLADGDYPVAAVQALLADLPAGAVAPSNGPGPDPVGGTTVGVAHGGDHGTERSGTGGAEGGAVSAGISAPRVAPASVRTRRAGLGSLGRPRLVALAHLHGSLVAREVKALLPSAWDWASGEPDSEVRYGRIIAGAVRDSDPGTSIQGSWVLRRLAPDCSRIELADLPAERDEALLLHAMGAELANVHLATPGALGAVLDDLAHRRQHHPGWLAAAAQTMADDTDHDWNSWRH
ncbi:MAG: DUF2252 family protein [Acidimicrobiales bacterium]